MRGVNIRIGLIRSITANMNRRLLSYSGVKVGWNASKHSSGAHQFRHKRPGAQTSDYLGRNARSTAHKTLYQRFAVLNIVNYNN